MWQWGVAIVHVLLLLFILKFCDNGIVDNVGVLVLILSTHRGIKVIAILN